MRAGLPLISDSGKITASMSKGERISRFIEELEGTAPQAAGDNVARHPCYRGFFTCWNEQRYYEAHDVLEHLWLDTESEDADYFKGLIQAAGGFVHLQKHFEHPTHRVHGRRLAPAVRLFRLAEKNLQPFAPVRHSFDIDYLLGLIRREVDAIVDSNFTRNPWSPQTASRLSLRET
jgi:predicted metal-dependent hydrolase